MLLNFRKIIFKIIFITLIIYPFKTMSSDYEDGLKAYNNKEYFKALSSWKTLIEQGNLKAEYYIGIMYYKGLGVPQNIEFATKFIESSSNKGYVPAMVDLARIYQKQGMLQRPIALYEKSISLENDARANYFLGEILLNKKFAYYDFKKGLNLLNEASKLGEPRASVKLGYLYEKGDRVKKDIKTAVKYYKIADLKQNIFARNRLKSLVPNYIPSKNEPKAIKNAQLNTLPKFKKVNINPYDIAIIIGNKNYEKLGNDIPDVTPAHNDAKFFHSYFENQLGIKNDNIIFIKDATGSQLISIFGNQNSHKGKLFNWMKKNKSNIHIFYSGHGFPGKKGEKSFIVPIDADLQTINLTGYPLETLYKNLSKLSAKSVTVYLEACFSGNTPVGNLFPKSSRMIMLKSEDKIPVNLKVYSAGSNNQIASWEKDSSNGLFTKYFLKAVNGEADINKDGVVLDNEIKLYLEDTMTYFARRYYGREQHVKISN
jgi:tetratricopeptide (TPR) repeat protein